MKCSECNYYWQEEEDGYPRCHCDPNFPAPCEEPDNGDYEPEEFEPGREYWDEMAANP